MKIGKLININYSQLKAKISSDIRGGSVVINGEIYYFGNIGSYLKIKNAIEEVIICEVVSIFDSDMQQEKLSFDVESNRELLLKPIGTIDKDKKFTLGVGIFPSLYSDVNIVTSDDMEIILSIKSQTTNNTPNMVHTSFSLGVSKNLINYPIDINIDNFFNIHSAILGNSGSGKSNTIAHIIQEIHKKESNSAIGSRILIFDVNGEYKQAFKTNTNITVSYYKPNLQEDKDEDIKPFYLPHFLMSLDEWSAFLLATDATQRPFWNKVLQESYRFYKIGDSTEEEQKFINYLRYRLCSLVYSALRQADSDTSRITTSASMIWSILAIINNDKKLANASKDLITDIESLQNACTISFGENKDKLEQATKEVSNKINNVQVQEVINSKIKNGVFFDYKFLKIASDLVLLEEEARGNKQIRGFVATMMTRLDYFLENPDCGFMRESNNIKSINDYLKDLWQEDTTEIQLAIIDTSELSPDILETLTSVTSRLLFDERRKLTGSERREKPTHLILDEAHRYIKKNYEYIMKENIFEKIAREGRKFAFYLLISSQRPSELSETVLSQCANFIIHRIQNERDMHYIQAILPYFSDDFANKIKQSIPGEALVFGSCVSMPLHLKIHEANPQPNSDNCKIAQEWFKNKKEKEKQQK